MGDPRVNLVNRMSGVDARNRLCGRHHLHRHLRGLVSTWQPSSTHGTARSSAGLCPSASPRNARGGCARAGGRQEDPLPTSACSMTIRASSTRPRIPALPGVPWDSPIDVEARQPMGQRARRILLQDPEAELVKGRSTRQETGAAGYLLEYIELYTTGRGMHSIGYNVLCDLEREAA